jgi:hypothetical protein
VSALIVILLIVVGLIYWPVQTLLVLILLRLMAPGCARVMNNLIAGR